MSLEVDIRKRLGSFELDAQFAAPDGLTVLFGRSGSGKTSIINALSGLSHPGSGVIRLQDRVLFDGNAGINLAPPQRRIGYIFQDGRLFPHMSVARNLRYGLRDLSKGEQARIIEMLGLGPLLTRRPAHLSGGEKQRVAIARALFSQPDLLLADEPLAALDEARKAEILPYFERLRDEVKVPILYVSHAAAEVARLATTIVAVEDGRVVAQGPALDVLGDARVLPTGVRAAGAVLQATVARHHTDGLTELSANGIALHLPRINHAIGSAVRVRIAAQDVILSRARPVGLSALNILGGQITDIRPGTGPGTIITVQTPAGRVLARVTQRSALSMGLEVGVSCHAIVKTVAIAPQDVG